MIFSIHQPHYLPWKGYFDIINMVDEFILYDDMQYTRRDWRNRNKIKTPRGLKWLTIPVEVKGRYYQKIKDTRVSDMCWNKKHWDTIKQFYGRAPYFKKYKKYFEELYLGMNHEYLSLINYEFILSINRLLGIETKITWSSDYEIVDGKTERLVSLCLQAGATFYLSGPAAKDYIVPELFEKVGISLEWMDYSDYPKYEQLFPPFEHGVTICDLIFSVGAERAPYYMKSFGDVE